MDLVACAQGGLDYDKMKDYPVSELFALNRQFAKINKQMTNSVK